LIGLRRWLSGANPTSDPCLALDASQEALSRLFDDLELGLAPVDSELIKQPVFGVFDGLCGGL